MDIFSIINSDTFIDILIVANVVLILLNRYNLGKITKLREEYIRLITAVNTKTDDQLIAMLDTMDRYIADIGIGKEEGKVEEKPKIKIP